TCNLQPATCNPATCNLQLCNYATLQLCNLQLCNLQPATCNSATSPLPPPTMNQNRVSRSDGKLINLVLKQGHLFVCRG
ncbi:MAG: hypothetical protein KIH69_009595, partial [Anaerolineae bacterium]|nr:hypothetical protein [Anaerolineae bacterium]